MQESALAFISNLAANLGFVGTDASPLISLAEYDFLAKQKSADEYTVLLNVPETYPGGPGFKFFTVTESDFNDFAFNEAPLNALGFETPEEYLGATSPLFLISDLIRHRNYFSPMSYADSPISVQRTADALRKYHADYEAVN
ncbi:hypothetical protein [Salinibacter phage M8CRM-1]|uniref:Uncharacterized protein n=1 Tax=Salinibacter phage M8CRM-1 TaxID=2681612 RepID=A0A2I6UGM2_9CAUD|nr:hypothetical protein FGG67_gp59 [Salinibacter phage M8CRM-1]AUO79143.1 hypothetical protein [Salinibacter phage M8CRM-1]